MKTAFQLILAMLLALSAFPAAGADVPPDWQCIRDKQPAGLSLRAELTKTTFALGEAIAVRLVYENTSPEPYAVMEMFDGSPIKTGAVFYAWDAAGQPCPAAQLGSRSDSFSRAAFDRPLGTWSTMYVANETVRFEKPGQYALVAVGSAHLPYVEGKETPRFRLVTDPVTITIVPLDPETEKRLIAEARTPAENGTAMADTRERSLRVLDTPAARRALAPQVDPNAFKMAADPESAGAELLAGVRDGTFAFNAQVAKLYADLVAPNPLESWMPSIGPLRCEVPGPSTPPTGEQATKSQEQLAAEFKAKYALNEEARDYITNEARKTVGTTGPAYTGLLLASLGTQPEKRAETYAELAKVQLELPEKQELDLISSFQGKPHPEFLPLMRKRVQERHMREIPFRALLVTAPREAREVFVELVIAYLKKDISSLGEDVLFALPEAVMPELDAPLRERLVKLEKNQEQANSEVLMLACRYGGPTMLPEIVTAYSEQFPRLWTQAAVVVLRFWIEHDPEQGYAALGRALAVQDISHKAYTRSLLRNMYEKTWDPKVQDMVIAAVDSPNQEIACDAIMTLSRHVDQPGLLERCLTVLEGLGPYIPVIPPGYYSPDPPRDLSPRFNLARELRTSREPLPSWKPSSEQIARLKAIEALAPKRG